MIRVAMFDTKSYDEEFFNRVCKRNIKITYFEERLSLKNVSLCKGFDAIIVFVNDDVNKSVIEKLVLYKIKLIALRCAGFNNIDLKSLKGRIKVVRVSAYSPSSVAEFVMAMLLTLIRKTHKAYIRVKDYNFSLDNLIGFNLKDKTIGIIGMGKIGTCLKKICLGFDMKVIYNDRIDKESVPLDYLFKNSDIISLNCPLTNETKYLINQESIKHMKKGVIIVNTSRGELINSKDLLKGLRSGKIQGACLDVYEEEENIFFENKSNNILKDDVLLKLIAHPRVLMTSHQGFLTKEALENIALTTIDNILNFFEKNILLNEVKF